MRVKPLHRQLYSPEREEIERRAEYFELEARRRQRLVTIGAVGFGLVLGATLIGGIFAVLKAVL